MDSILFKSDFSGFYIIRLFVAALLGAFIGLERDIHGKTAGLRTNLLISLGTSVFTIVSETIAMQFIITKQLASVSDPGRIAAQIVTGIGFLGAGAIIKHGFSVRGLTTSACIWLSAAVGMASGFGYFGLAVITTVIGLLSLLILNVFEKKYMKYSYRILEIKTSDTAEPEGIVEIFKKYRIQVLYLDLKADYEDKSMNLIFTLRLKHKEIADKYAHPLMQELSKLGITIHKITWSHK